jgi:hypothetical protein
VGPIDHIIEDKKNGGFWVVSYNTLYHCNQSFSRWTKPLELGGRWIGGRKYSVGFTPTVKRLLVGEGAPLTLIAVMGLDGLVRVENTKVTEFSFPAELEGSTMDIWDTSIGSIVVSDDSFHRVWRHIRNGWANLPLMPPKPLKDKGFWYFWYFAEPIGEEGGKLVAYASVNTEGERYIFEVDKEGKLEVKCGWTGSEDEFDTSFLFTASRVLIKVTRENHLEIWDTDQWKNAGILTAPDLFDTSRGSMPRGRHYASLGTKNNSELFLDNEHGDLLQLDRDGDHYSLSPLTCDNARLPSEIYDATVDKDGWLLIASVQGLVRFRPRDCAMEAIPGPNAHDEVKTIARDELGRLWIAAENVYVSPDGGRHWSVVDLPMVTATNSKKIRKVADGAGVVVSLYDMGVLYLQW